MVYDQVAESARELRNRVILQAKLQEKEEAEAEGRRAVMNQRQRIQPEDLKVHAPAKLPEFGGG